MVQFRFLTAYLAIVVIALAGLRLFLFGTESLLPQNNIWRKERLRGVLDHVPRLPKDTRSVLLLGTSELQTGIDPRIVEETLARTDHRVWNYSVENVGTFLPLYFDRIANEMKAQGLHAAALIIHLPPPRLTQKSARGNAAQAQHHDLMSVCLTLPLLKDLNLPFEDKVALAFNKWILGERSLMQIPIWLNGGARDALGLREWDAQASLWHDGEFHPFPAWNPESQGYHFFNYDGNTDRVKERITAIQTEAGFQRSVRYQDSCCGLYELNFSRPYLEDVRSALQRLSLFADHLVLVELPEHPSLKRSTDSLRKLDSLYEFMKDSTGFKVWRARELRPPTAEDFLDVTHLSLKGMAKYSRDLGVRTQALIDSAKTESK